MGWTYTYKEPGQSTRSFLEQRLNWQREDGTFGKILDCAVVNLRTAYMAYQVKLEKDPEPRVIALVCLLDYAPHDSHNFG